MSWQEPAPPLHFTGVRETSKDMEIPGDFLLWQVLMMCTTVVETGMRRERG